jgi:hypothetical protein
MNIVEIIALGRGLDAFGFLLSVVGLDAQAGVVVVNEFWTLV